MAVIKAIQQPASLPFSMVDIEREAAALVQDARRQAARIVEQARSEIELMRQGGYDAGFQEGRQAGLEEGTALGREQGRKEAADAHRAMEERSHYGKIVLLTAAAARAIL